MAQLRPTQEAGPLLQVSLGVRGCRVALGQAGPSDRLGRHLLSHTHRRGAARRPWSSSRQASEATGASRPGLPRLSLSAAQADQQRRVGTAPASPALPKLTVSPRCPGCPGPCPYWGPLQKAKEGSFICVPRHTHLQDFVPPQRTKATFHFKELSSSKVTATSTAGAGSGHRPLPKTPPSSLRATAFHGA